MSKTVKIKLTILFTILLIASVFGFTLAPKLTARADESLALSPFMPTTSLETYSPTAPQDAYSNGNLFIINEQGKNLMVSKDNGMPEVKATFDSLGLIRKLDEDSLLISNGGSIYKLSTIDWSLSPITDATTGLNIGSTFDYNGNYLITGDNSTAIIYTINGAKAEKINAFTTINKSPVAINNAGNVFFVNVDGKLCITDVEKNGELVIYSGTPTKIIANDNFAYFISGGKIFKCDLTNSYTITELKTQEKHSKFNLGNVINPTGISFKGENLLITTAEENQIANSFSAAQEFTVNGEYLVFTSFAVASEKTAFNRSGKSAKDVGIYENNFAVLDDFKLTLNYNGEFYNLLISELNGYIPTGASVGKNTILLTNADQGEYKLLNIEDFSEISSGTINGNNLTDVYYSNGRYYLLSLALNAEGDGTVYTITESGNLTTEFSITGFYDGTPFPQITADNFNNIYILNTKENKIIKFFNEQTEVYSQNVENGAIEFSIDLNGKVYLLYQDKLTAYFKDQSFTIELNPNLTAKDFALSFSTKNTLYLFQDKEAVYFSNNALNACIQDTLVPTDFITQDVSTDINNLTIYSVSENSVLYSVKVNENKFDYLGTFNSQLADYVLITKVEISGGATIGLTEYSILLGNGLYIAPTSILQNVTQNRINQINESTYFVTTDVSAYYLPVITISDSYLLKDYARLKTGDSFTATHKLEFLGREFYYAKLNENTFGYIPVNFTTPILSKDALIENYKLKKVIQSEIFADADMQNSIITLEENTLVKLVKIEKDVAEIYFETETGWIHGYTLKSNLKSTPNTALKTALVVFSTTLVVFATSLYLILKKRED